MNYAKKLNLHWFCTQNHILEPFSVRRACTKSYVTSEPYPQASQIWCQNVRETRKKKVITCRGESFARCRVITRNVEGGPKSPPPPVFLGLNYESKYCQTFRNWGQYVTKIVKTNIRKYTSWQLPSRHHLQTWQCHRLWLINSWLAPWGSDLGIHLQQN